MKKIDVEKELANLTKKQVIDHKVNIELEYHDVNSLIDFLEPYRGHEIDLDYGEYNDGYHIRIYREETDVEFDRRKKKLEKEWTNHNIQVDKETKKKEVDKESRIKKLEKELAKLKGG